MMLQESAAVETPPSFPNFPVNSSREAILDNLRINIKRTLPILTERPATDKLLLIVGGGPSLKDYIGYVKALAGDADVLAINGSYKYLKSQGVHSKYFVLLDSRKENLAHVDDPLSQTEHLLASQAHPAVYHALKSHFVTMFHVGTDTNMEVLKDKPGTPFVTAPIGFAGVYAVYIAAVLGYRNLALFGYDFSHADTHHAFSQPMNDGDESVEVTFKDKKYRTTVAMALGAQNFANAIVPVVEACKLNIQMCSEGLLPDILKEGVE